MHEASRSGSWVPAQRALIALAAAALGTAAGAGAVYLPAPLIAGAALGAVAVFLVLRRPYLGLLLYTATFFLRPGELVPALSALHLERLIGALTLAGLLLRQQTTSRRLILDGTLPTRLLLLLAGAVLLSVPFAYWRSAALDGFIDFLKLVVWYVLVVHLVDTRRRLQVFLFLFLGLVSWIAFDSFRAYLSGQFKYAQGIERVVGRTDAGGDPNHLAATMSATIPILLLLTFHQRNLLLRAAAAASGILMTVTMLLTGSRSGLLAFLAGLIFLWWGARHRLLLLLAGITVAAAAATALPEQYRERYSTIGRSTLDGSSQGRVEVWQKGLRMMVDRPLTGVGISCFGIANSIRYSPEFQPSFLESHSLYVQVPAEIGPAGAFLFFAFLFAVFRSARGLRRRFAATGPAWGFEAALLRGLAAAMVGLLVAGVFGHSFLRHTWYVYAAIVTVILRLYARAPAVESPPRTRTATGILRAGPRKPD